MTTTPHIDFVSISGTAPFDWLPLLTNIRAGEIRAAQFPHENYMGAQYTTFYTILKDP